MPAPQAITPCRSQSLRQWALFFCEDAVRLLQTDRVEYRIAQIRVARHELGGVPPMAERHEYLLTPDCP
jgi:hypothetical protein